MVPVSRLYHALSCRETDRIPFVPKIWLDWSAAFLGTKLTDALTDPLIALECIPKAASSLGLDGARMFHFPKKSIRTEGDSVYEVDEKGRTIGTIDMQGGLATILLDGVELRLDDPYYSAHHHCWKTYRPMEASISKVRDIAVPTRKDLYDMGWGPRQSAVMDAYGTQTALIGDCHTATMAYLVSLRGMEQAIFDLYDNPRFAHAVMEKGVEIAVEKGKFHADMGITILRLNDSVGNMSVLSPDLWRTFVFPHIKNVCRELHAYDQSIRVYCHICGNVEPILEDLADTGLDCIGPLDPLGGMSPKLARSRVGDDIALMGGLNTMSFITSTPDEIITEAKHCIEGGGNTGYILASGCAVPRNAREELITTLRDYVAGA